MREPTNADIMERLGGIDANVKTLVERGTDHEMRLRSLERMRYYVLGAAAVVVFGFTSIKEAAIAYFNLR